MEEIINQLKEVIHTREFLFAPNPSEDSLKLAYSLRKLEEVQAKYDNIVNAEFIYQKKYSEHYKELKEYADSLGATPIFQIKIEYVKDMEFVDQFVCGLKFSSGVTYHTPHSKFSDCLKELKKNVGKVDALGYREPMVAPPEPDDFVCPEDECYTEEDCGYPVSVSAETEEDSPELGSERIKREKLRGSPISPPRKILTRVLPPYIR